MGAQQSAEEPTLESSDSVHQSQSLRTEVREPRSGRSSARSNFSSKEHSSVSSTGGDNLDSSCRSVSSRSGAPAGSDNHVLGSSLQKHKGQRGKKHLAAWELSDSDDDDVATRRHAAGGHSSHTSWSPFMTEEETREREEEEAQARLHEFVGNIGGAVWKTDAKGGAWDYHDANQFPEGRNSYEQGVLKLKATHSRYSANPSTVALPPPPNDGMIEQHLAPAVENPGSDAESASSDDEDPEDRRNREKTIQDELRVTQEHLGIEILENNIRLKKLKAQDLTVEKAAKAIQHATKFKLNVMSENMTSLNKAKAEGKGPEIAQRKMLAWIAMATVVKRMTLKLKDGIGEQYQQKMLKGLAPPPLPPPMDPPPSGSDEQLHYDYEDMRIKYAHQWEMAGQTMLGKAKFDEIRNMRTDNGPSQRMKAMVMKKCSEQADIVMSEQEHQDFIKRAWRLRNDWQPLEEYEEELKQARLVRESRLAKGGGASGSNRIGQVQLPGGAR